MALLLCFPIDCLTAASRTERDALDHAISIQMEQKAYQIVALGDSISAGYEPGMNESSVPYGYVERLKEQGLYHGRTRVYNYGILGLTSNGLKNYVSAIQNGVAVKPETIQRGLLDPRISAFAAGIADTRAALEHADLITITIGGNDLYSLLTDIESYSVTEIEAKGRELMNIYTQNVREVIDDLTTINPHAQIILMDQYQPVPKMIIGSAYSYLQSAADSFTAAVEGLASEYAGQGKLVKAVNVAKAFKGREIALTHIFPGGDIHPNQSGYEVIAKVVAEEVWGSYQENSVLQEGMPVKIVVKGEKLQSPNIPVLRQGQTFLALRDITEAVGASSSWDSLNNTASVTYNGRKVIIPIGSSKIIANGEEIPTNNPAFLNIIGQEAKTYIPLALLAQGLGLDVQYAEKSKTVFINL
ncbi:copper amine oxidase [Paenibacillus lentus]|uniref:Copper amine oxidase n=2 Tax=Paenibacillus lentus TaxID=1338368 RepID=A0A3S8RPA9_9BACL|nr:copper amine oxidase [Paenibacillus lentus]